MWDVLLKDNSDIVLFVTLIQISGIFIYFRKVYISLECVFILYIDVDLLIYKNPLASERI